MNLGRRWQGAGMLLGVVALLGLVVMVSGVTPIGASSGHWAVTRWVLHFSMRRAVATHALGVDAPAALDDPAWVLRGAGHFEVGCRPCHGAPGTTMPRVVAAMTPAPPPLAERVGELSPEELFYVVRHGVKFTGMPAWSSAMRDDEVWPVVAFLRELPGLDAEAYQRLVRDDAIPPREVPELVRRSCAGCHGYDGRGRMPGAFPHLAGQSPTYLRATLRAYAAGERHSGTMEPIAAALDEQAIEVVSDYYAALEPARATGGSALGRRIARSGVPTRFIPACNDCHSPDGRRRRDAYPRLEGQDAAYLAGQLELFMDGRRGGTAYADVMRTVAEHELQPEELDAVAAFYAGDDP